MEEHSLNISGKQSLTFMGEELAMVSSRNTSKDTRYEWDTVRVFRVDPVWARNQQAKTGKVISPFKVGWEHRSTWEGDPNRYRVFHPRTLEQAVGIVRSWVPQFEREISYKLRINTQSPGTLQRRENAITDTN
jgi:hypothetical protein